MNFFTDLLLTFFGKECSCVYCGRAGARSYWFLTKCRNPNCNRFDNEYAQRFERRKQTGQGFPPAGQPAADLPSPNTPSSTGSIDPGVKSR